MTTIYLVSCVSKKKDIASPAESMYQSPLFFKTSAYARKNADRWYILSAKYGLLAPDTIIHPYDKTLNKMLKPERLAWADTVFQALVKVTTPQDKIVFLAGQKYREYLSPKLETRGNAIDVPMVGLKIGEQLGWLKQKLD